MKEPVKPNDEDCCSSGCNPCIFDVYEKQMKLYEEYKKNGKTSNEIQNTISPLEYHQFVLIDNIDLCNEHQLLLFRLNNDNTQVIWRPGDHFLVKYVSDTASCTRAYTPLRLKKSEKDYNFAVVLKRYPNGLVSNYLCSLKEGDLTVWRGPYGSYSLPSNDINRIVMIAQGTGIAPFFAIIDHILKDEDNLTQLLLVYCSKNVDSILFRNELYNYNSYWNFKYTIYLSETDVTPGLKYKEPILLRKFQPENLYELKPFFSKDQFLVCGSKSFMEYFRSIIIKENVNECNIVTF